MDILAKDAGRDSHDYSDSTLDDAVAGDVRKESTKPVIESEEPEVRRISKARLRVRLLLAGLIVLLVGALFAYLHGGRYEETDNAQIQAGQAAVAANVSGQVIAIEVQENQVVKRGQVLFRIDPRPFQAAVAEAQARLAEAQAQIGSRRATYRQNRADVDAAQAQLDYAAAEAARQKQLLAEGISSRNQYDQAVLAVQTARQMIATRSEQAESVRAELSGNVDAPAGTQPAVQAARAVLERARLNLDYTVVRAAQDGIVTRVNQLQLGNYVTASKPMFTLVGTRIWVAANFKENQLRNMRLGQAATVEIDAFSGQKLKAHVTSFSPGTGNSFSLLPAENATGNWVKVVQRLPVELTFDELPKDLPLHAGLSAAVTVDTGHVRRLFGKDELAPSRAAMSTAAMRAPVYPDAATRRLITLPLLVVMVMNALDMTIANVALPHMQGSVSASSDEITWVLTSYIVASAIAIPLAGWLADRFGRRPVLIISVVGFTISSALCGAATSLWEIVLFRLIQGATGAALMPMSQSTLLDINPPEKHGSAMALLSMAAVLAPICGPVLGGWLTDNFSWRWCFLINVPFGIAATFAMLRWLPRAEADKSTRFDLFGFAMLALSIGLFQLMHDRGQTQDWFSSTEIWIEAALAAFAFYCFVVHILTAPNPFISLAIFKDLNFSFGTFFAFFVGMSLFSVLSLLPSMLQRLMGFPVLMTGMVMMPRGVGGFISMAVVATAMRYIDARALISFGFVLVAVALYIMSDFSLAMDGHLVVVSGFLNGLGNGFAFVPVSTIAFATLAPHLRNQASAMYTLIRNLGSAVGISIMSTMTYRTTETVHSRLVENIRPDNPVLELRYPDMDFGLPGAVAAIEGEISRQASMVAYVNVYWLLAIAVVAVIPLVWFMKTPKKIDPDMPTVHLE